MNKNKFFKMYSCCVVVKGYMRSGLLDNQRNNFYLIPNSLYEVIIDSENLSYREIIIKYNLENKLIIEDYFTWLLENNLGFWCNLSEFERFPKVDPRSYVPYIIENIILDIEILDCFDYNLLLKKIMLLSIPVVQIRFFTNICFEDLESFIKIFKNSRVENIEILLQYENGTDEFKYIKLIKSELRISNIVFAGSKENKIDVFFDGLSKIVHTDKKITSCLNCGVISKDYFRINQKLFNESQNYNTCLNRKISIDKDGNIKNCPSMTESFGNIKDVTLEEAINHPNFKKYWNITKDQIDVCKDCEFRHICTDCRAYIENPENQYSKPLKCGYNPYTNVWEEWSTNPLKQKAIKHYGMPELEIKENA